MAVALEREMETFQRALPELLQREVNRGKYVVIQGTTVGAVFGTVEEALDAGYDLFGLDPFLVKEITDHEEPQFFSRNVSKCQ